MTENKLRDSKSQQHPLPREAKLRISVIGAVLSGLFLTLIWALGLGLFPWLIYAAGPLVLGVWLARTTTVVIHEPADEEPANGFAVVSNGDEPPVSRTAVGLSATIALLLFSTVAFNFFTAPTDSPELIQARSECSTTWETFEETRTASAQRSWTECLVRNPSLIAECGMSANFAGAMLSAESISEINIDASNLMTCGESIY